MSVNHAVYSKLYQTMQLNDSGHKQLAVVQYKQLKCKASNITAQSTARGVLWVVGFETHHPPSPIAPMV